VATCVCVYVRDLTRDLKGCYSLRPDHFGNLLGRHVAGEVQKREVAWERLIKSVLHCVKLLERGLNEC